MLMLRNLQTKLPFSYSYHHRLFVASVTCCQVGSWQPFCAYKNSNVPRLTVPGILLTTAAVCLGMWDNFMFNRREKCFYVIITHYRQSQPCASHIKSVNDFLFFKTTLHSDYHQYLLQHHHNSYRLNQRKRSNTIIRLHQTRIKSSDCFVVIEKGHPSLLNLELC